MIDDAHEPDFPWRIPMPVIVLLTIVVATLTLAALGLVGVLSFGYGAPGAMGFDLRWPDDEMGRIVWVQSALTLISMFLIWLFSILVVAAYFQGLHRAAAGNAQGLVRVSIIIVVVRFVVSSAIPFILAGTWSGGFAVIATGAPMVLASVALFVAADFYFGSIKQNAPS